MLNGSSSWFRVNDWGQSKAALLMSLVYVSALWFKIDFKDLWTILLLSLTTIGGFASMGYLINDFFDLKKDVIAGKRNFLTNKSPGTVIILFFISTLCLLLPWLYLPSNALSIVLIITEVLLFVVYAMPPIRLKERGFAGVLTDATYAHALPALFAVYTFSLLNKASVGFLLALTLVVWQLASGVRNILIHQIEDMPADKKGGTATFSSSMPLPTLYSMIGIIIGIEVVFSVLFFTALSFSQTGFGLCVFIILFHAIKYWIVFFNTGVEEMITIPAWRYFPNNVFEKWIPIIVLAVLSGSNPMFLLILVLHILVFNFHLALQTKHYIELLTLRAYYLFKHIFIYRLYYWVRNMFSKVVNYSIFYVLLFFGVNLKKENTTLVGYFKRIRSRNKVKH